MLFHFFFYFYLYIPIVWCALFFSLSLVGTLVLFANYVNAFVSSVWLHFVGWMVLLLRQWFAWQTISLLSLENYFYGFMLVGTFSYNDISFLSSYWQTYFLIQSHLLRRSRFFGWHQNIRFYPTIIFSSNTRTIFHSEAHRKFTTQFNMYAQCENVITHLGNVSSRRRKVKSSSISILSNSLIFFIATLIFIVQQMLSSLSLIHFKTLDYFDCLLFLLLSFVHVFFPSFLSILLIP